MTSALISNDAAVSDPTNELIVAILKEGEAGMAVAEVCRKHGPGFAGVHLGVVEERNGEPTPVNI